MNLLFILNPVAGHGKNSALRIIPEIEEYCRDKSINYEIQKTEYRGHATLLTKTALNSSNSYDAIISVGGDGTLLEVANGLLGSDMSLGLLPAGSGNDFARALGIPSNIGAALELLNEPKTRLIDVANFQDMFFVNVASVGFDAEIIRDLLKIKRFIPGRASYYAAILLKFFTYKFKNISVTLDDLKFKEKIFLLAIANGTHYGGGMKVNPNGSLDDGYLDVIIINSLPRYKIPFLMTKFIKGKYQDLPFVKTYRCKKVTVDSLDKLVINADGDILASTPATFTARPLALNVIGS
ncbi:MAG TPA: diacylglycerol kinase family protein [Clostridia bacterium]|nr:diacylglycerol kinase family protein [Clostridia bacterium]